MTESDFVVARLDPACRLLAECTSAPEAKRIADIGHAAEVYARRQKLGQSAIKRAHAVVIDAQTLMGEFLKRAEKNKGMAGSKVTGNH